MKALRGQQALLTGDRDLGKDCKWMDGIKILTLKGREESSVEDGLKGRAVGANGIHPWSQGVTGDNGLGSGCLQPKFEVFFCQLRDARNHDGP